MIKEVFISDKWKKGLGTQICTLSGLYNYGIKTIAFENENSEYRNFLILKQYFDLDIEINLNNKNYFSLHADDFFKIHTAYISKNSSNKIAKYIGLSLYNDGNVMHDNLSHYPYYKQYNFEEYQKIIMHVKSMGYDIITLDSRDNDLNSKLHILDNMIEAIISYEGGMAHLAHCLNIPVFMIPWRIRSTDYLEELLHLDDRTYFLSDIQEILNFDRIKFEKTISELKLRKGNNRFINGSLSLKEKNNRYSVNKIQIPLSFDKSELDFFLKWKNK